MGMTRRGIGILAQHDHADTVRGGEFECPEELAGSGKDGMTGGDVELEEAVDAFQRFRGKMRSEGDAPRFGEGRNHAPASPGSGSDSGDAAGASSPLSAGDSVPENFQTPLKRAVNSPPPNRVLRKNVHVSG